ncbi:MAG TPA: sugar phosphate isomerase/epimerase family protein [Nakamurella sp.]|nr:sugar phosphate isomerase/epimerase family protein [Nakamurella sp.]
MTARHHPGPPARLAFSTLGCPGLAVTDVAQLAADNGFAAVELRARSGEPVHAGLDAGQRRAVRAAFDRRGVGVLAIASYVKVADASTGDDEVVADAVAHARLAGDLGAAFLRVFPGGPADVPAASLDAIAARRLRRIQRALAGIPVTVALETHDSHPRAADCVRILDRCPGVVAIWDALHPWRSGEPPTDTARLLGERIGYVQVKDVASRTDLIPLPPGDGVLPLADMADALRRIGYRGWVSWEYERAWFPELPALPELAGRVSARMRELFG